MPVHKDHHCPGRRGKPPGMALAPLEFRLHSRDWQRDPFDLTRDHVRIAYAAESAPAVYTIQLVGMDGIVLTTFSFEEMELLSVGSLLDLMEDDRIDGVPGAQKDGRGIFMQHAEFRFWSMGIRPSLWHMHFI